MACWLRSRCFSSRMMCPFQDSSDLPPAPGAGGRLPRGDTPRALAVTTAMMPAARRASCRGQRLTERPEVPGSPALKPRLLSPPPCCSLLLLFTPLLLWFVLLSSLTFGAFLTLLGAETRARLCGSRPITARSALKELQTCPTGVFVVPLDMTSAPFSKAFKVLRHCSQLLLCDSVPPGLRAAWGCTCRTEVQVLGGACCRGPGSHQPC